MSPRAPSRRSEPGSRCGLAWSHVHASGVGCDIGTLLPELGEAAAREGGFKRSKDVASTAAARSTGSSLLADLLRSTVRMESIT